MNKKIFLKLGVVLLSLSFVACGQKNNSVGEDNSFDASINHSVDSDENSEGESGETTSSIIENEQEDKQGEGDVQKDTESDIQQDTQKKLTEDEYYIIIKEAWQKEEDYINSIDDPQVKQSLQSSYSAAIAESTALYLKYPEDTNTIDEALQRVLNGE